MRGLAKPIFTEAYRLAKTSAEERPLVAQSVAIAIGPEGGWTPEEMSLFTQHQWQPVTLGPRILRAETAAIAAIAIAATHLI